MDYYTDTSNLTGTNMTFGDNDYLCFGNDGCSDSYITFNGTTLIIKVS